MPNIHKELEKARLQLLDTSTRNRLLSVPQHGRAKLVHIVDERSDEAFRILCQDGKSFTFLETEEKDSEDGHSDDLPGPQLAQPDEDEELDERGVATRHSDTKLQTKLGPEALQKRLLALHYDARTAIEETGVNTLFIALGQLKWRDSNNSEIDRFAPLLFIPVQLTRKGVKSKFRLSALETEAHENLSLIAKLKSMGITAPTWVPDDESTLHEYFSAFNDAVAEQKGWELLPNQIVIGMFSFSKFLMHRDLDPETWPEGSPLHSHGLVANLMGDGFPMPDSTIDPNANLDQLVPVERLSYVIDADSSQSIAVEEVRRDQSIIIQGPPGTGKSQTITNLIATAVLDGKKVLFVAEKLAALEVVKRRLDALGLGPMALELHSHKSDKKSVLADLSMTLDLGMPQAAGTESTLQDLDHLRQQLNAHTAMLNEPRKPSGLNAMHVIGRLCELKDGIRDIDPPKLDGALGWTKEERIEREHLMDDLESRTGELGHPAKHPWRGVRRTILTKFDGEDVANSLPALKAAFVSLEKESPILAGLLGDEPPSDLVQTQILLAKAKAITSAPDLDFAALAASAWKRDIAILKAVVESGQATAEAREKYGDRFVDAAWTTDVSTIRQAVAAHGQSLLRILNSDFRGAMAAFRSLLKNPKPPKSHAERLELLDALTKGESLKRELDEHGERVAKAFGERWSGTRSDWNALHEIILWVEKAKDQGLDQKFITHLAEQQLDRDKCQESADKIANALKDFQDRFSRLATKTELDLGQAFGSTQLDSIPLVVLGERIEEWDRSAESLHSWIAYFNRVKKCKELGIGSIPSGISEGTLEADQARLVFDYGYLKQLYNGFAEQTPELAQFDGQSHSQLVSRFRRIDSERIDIARYEVMQKHFNDLPNGTAGSMGALGILRGEMARKRGHMPIRKLLGKTEGAIQAIKPVFMMSPMSVAQFLEPGTISFDLLIFDEASQIEPVDALGAIARANQIVVVGDEKQLPPSKFFASQNLESEEEDDDGTAGAGDMESLLGLANAKGLPSVMLRWHYRSRHQSLIAVSNHEFYDDNLFIIPSPQCEMTDVGLGFHYIENGVFDRGKSYRNPVEARAVAEGVIRHAETRPEKSLGIGAFSVAQRDAIIDELELLRRQRPDLENFFHSHEHEPFFVKNLENLQGDERDVIFISLGYAKDKDGFFGMNFGPLNRDGGERRLNVLISRAKERCEVFASIHADEIDLNRSKTRGVAALKTFLQFAETGILGTADPKSDRGIDSPFEESVKRAIEREGYEVHPQVGTAGFFIDLAVIDPKQPSRYILGIECDGATYHSARSARERDRQREAVLRNHGWKIHRIWSTDWFMQPQAQLERVLQAIEEAISVSGQAPVTKTPQETAPIPRLERAEQEPLEETIFEEYEEAHYDLETDLEIHEVSTDWMMELVIYILKVEGPVHTNEVITRVRELWGVGRAGSRIKEKVRKAVNRLAERDRIEQDGEFLQMPGQEIIVRDRSSAQSNSLRKPEMLPPSEIREAINLLIRSNHGVSEDEIAVGVGRMFGFRSTSKQLREAVNQEVESLLTSGLIVEHAGFLKLNEDR